MSNHSQNNLYDTNDRDVIYALRTVHQNQTQLVILADQKANILIGIVAIVFTILLTNAGFLETIDQRFILPLVIFLILEITGILLSFLVILPNNIKRLIGTPLQDVSNPLFFGTYTHFSENEYVRFLLEKMHDNKTARKFLLIDYYQIGQVLRKKYLLLKYAYGFAVSGFVLLLLYSGVLLPVI